MKWKLFSIFIVLSFIMVACNTTNEEGMRDNDRDGNVQQTRYNDDVNNNRNNVRDTRNGESDGRLENRRNGNVDNDRGNRENRDNNDRYEISKEAANKITDEITEIDSAYVLTTENNAYVAADLDVNNNRDDNRNGDDNANRDTNRNGDDNADRNRDNRNDDGANNVRNGDQGNQLTDDVKDEIADIVKSVDNDIDNVYVSTDPDFMDLTSNYVNDMGNGHPVRGFFDQMDDMIQRLFPQNK